MCSARLEPCSKMIETETYLCVSLLRREYSIVQKTMFQSRLTRVPKSFDTHVLTLDLLESRESKSGKSDSVIANWTPNEAASEGKACLIHL